MPVLAANTTGCKLTGGFFDKRQGRACHGLFVRTARMYERRESGVRSGLGDGAHLSLAWSNVTRFLGRPKGQNSRLVRFEGRASTLGISCAHAPEHAVRITACVA